MKIDKVQQPERDLLLFSLRGVTGGRRLLISAGTGDARIHLTERRFDNPPSPPMFCMLLRKHTTGAKITEVTQVPSERVVEIRLTAPDAMGVYSEKKLIIEMIGRSANIILTGSDGLIIDCLRRVGGELTDKRSVLPGLLYRMPPVQEGKYDPLIVTPEEWKELFIHAYETAGGAVDKWLISQFYALSPLICREIAWRAYTAADCRMETIADGGESLRREFFNVMEIAKSSRFEPWIVYNETGKPFDFSFFCILQYEGALDTRRTESFSAMLDGFYTDASQLARVRARASKAARTVKTARERLSRKLATQMAELENTAGRECYRECGDIITANLHLMMKGLLTLIAQDFYDPQGGTREIALDPLLTPQQNAAKYYRMYAKAKKAEKHLTELISAAECELGYLDSVLDQIDRAEDERDMTEITGELVQTGYIRTQKKNVEKKQTEPAPMQFISSSGFRILAGKNNTQNDRLTLKTAMRSDVWMHAAKIHGSHVIISCDSKPPDDATLAEAASIAVYHSAARYGNKTPVDYTLVRNVRKSPGGRPGMVVYTDYKTIIATPDEELVKRLRKL